MPITSEEENERILGEIDKLMSKPEGELSPEESALFDLMVKLVEDFEAKAYPMKKSTPDEVLKSLMESNKLTPKDLLPIFGSKGIVSETLSGKRGISKENAKALAKRFKVSAEVFI
ncbi:MAG TPA: transcriptional regulator [Blastocatellia bacterium]|nr:transcriptional regulator [Blastocatellia bacterium]